MKKIVLLIIGIFLLTGCSVRYHLEINEDLSLQEEIKMTGTSEFFSNYYKTTKKNVLKSILDTQEETLKEKNYEYKLVEDNVPYVLAKKKYASVSEFTKESVFFNDYFDEVNYTENGNIKKLETEGFNENNPDNPERFDVKELELSIKCNYKVKNHNAKKVDKKTNTYYFDLFESKKILLEYDTSKKFNPNEDMYIVIIFLGIVVISSWIAVIILNKKKKN